jgi:hypothetical protein
MARFPRAAMSNATKPLPAEGRMPIKSVFDRSFVGAKHAEAGWRPSTCRHPAKPLPTG